MSEKKPDKPDWRLDLCKSLYGQPFKFKKWHRPSYNSSWDHDHCSACTKKIWDGAVQGDEDAVHEGYASLATGEHAEDNDWICVECFSDLAKSQNWTIADRQT